MVSRGRDWAAVADRIGLNGRTGAAVGVVTVGLVGLVWAATSMLGSDQVAENSSESTGDETADVQDPIPQPVDDADGEMDSADSPSTAGGPAEVLELSVLDGRAGTGPVFGVPVDSYLFVSWPTRLLQVDLDDGDLTLYRSGARILGVSGEHLLMASNRKLYAAPVDDPARGGRLIHDLSLAANETIGRDINQDVSTVLNDGRLAVEVFTFPSATGATVVVDPSMVDPQPVEEIADNFFGRSAPGLAYSPGSGLFDIVGPVPRLLLDGAVVVAGSDRVVGYRCENPASCSTPVVDRSTGEVLVENLPELAAESWLTRFLDNQGRLLVTAEPDGTPRDELGQARIIDVVNGEVVAPDWPVPTPLGGSFNPDWFVGMAASEDSRFLVRVDGGELKFYDLELETDGSADLSLDVATSFVADGVVFASKVDR